MIRQEKQMYYDYDFSDFANRVNNSTNIDALKREKASIMSADHIRYRERNIKVELLDDRIKKLELENAKNHVS
jgi:hypothetical protein